MSRRRDSFTSGAVGNVHPSDRAAGKFEVTFDDGSVHPYVFRTAVEAQALLDQARAQQQQESTDGPEQPAEQ